MINTGTLRRAATDLGAAVLDFLGATVPPQEAPRNRDFNGIFMSGGVLILVSHNRYADEATLSSAVCDALNSKPILSYPKAPQLNFRVSVNDLARKYTDDPHMIIKESTRGYATLMVGRSTAPTALPRDQRDFAVNLLESHQYPLDARWNMMVQIQDYLAENSIPALA